MTAQTVRTVIFDLDGTLSNSAILTMRAMERVCPAFGLSLLSEATVKAAIGYPNPDFYYRLFPEFPRETVYEAGQQIERAEQDVLRDASGRLLFPGCRELLMRLKEHGVRLCIASTGDHEHVYSVLEQTGVIGCFDVIACGSADKAAMLREMIQDSDKRAFVMVGDMAIDSGAARDNGICSVGACYGYCKRERSEFDLYVDDPLELLKLLKLETK